MPQGDWLILVVMGGAFFLIGLVVLALGKREERKYDNSLSSRADMREFLDHWPPRPEPGALKVGGWIAIGIGLLLVVIGGAIWLWG